MPAETPPNDNRRRHARRELLATAMIFVPDRLHGTYLLQDLSSGGACLVGHLSPDPGTRLTMLLQVPDRQPFTVHAVVVRHDAFGMTRSRTAVTFVDLTIEQEDTIQQAITATLERERTRQAATVLVLAPDDDARDALEDDLHAIGHEPLGVSTPLEVLAWLERPGCRIRTVLIDISSGASQGLDVLEFLGEHHAHVHRVVISDGARPFRLDLALRTGRAHRILQKPWDRRSLLESLASGGSREGGSATD
jgi:CheY-like chemotaxis protein